MKNNKLEYLKKLIAINDLELFFDQILEELKIHDLIKKTNQMNDVSNEIILLSQNYFSLKKEIRLNTISIEDYRTQNNQIISGLLEILDNVEKNKAFERYINKENMAYKPIGLIIQRGEQVGRIFNISNILKEKNTIKIGRLDILNPKNNDINIVENDRFVSRHHATIIKQNHDYIIKDGQKKEDGFRKSWHQSLNGLFVNGKEVGISGIALKINDEIEMGMMILKVIGL